MHLTLKRQGCEFDHPCGVSKNVPFREKVKPWFFVTFNIIISHFFLENFIEIPEVVQKIFSININYIHQFWEFFDISLLQSKLFLPSTYFK